MGVAQDEFLLYGRSNLEQSVSNQAKQATTFNTGSFIPLLYIRNNLIF